MKVRKAVIPAAGLGTRMLPATKTVPKEMLPIAGKPSIQYIVEEAVAAGIEEILIITNRMKDVMEDYFDYLPELEAHLVHAGKDDEVKLVRSVADMANIFFVRQKETRGLGHAIWRAKQFVGNEPFAVLLGDDIMHSEVPVTRQLIVAAEKHNGSAVGVQYIPNDKIGKYCSLKVDSLGDNCYSVHDLIEKPKPEQIMSNFAILGRYVLTPDIFDILGGLKPGYGDEIQLTDGLAILCKQSNMVAVDFEGRRFDTGNATGYLEAILEMSLINPDTNEWLKTYIKEKAATL